MASETEHPKETAPPTFTEAVLGTAEGASGWRARLQAWPQDRRVAAAVALLGVLLFVPYLGAVGLWDPWETHYGEVARSMVVRGDYIYPYWESSWFFSKPPFTMWLQAAGMLLVGAMRNPGEMGLYTEWGMRLPFALLSITGLCLLAVALSRVVNRRVGLASAFVLGTMPLWALLTRQTVTDTPFVAALVCAMACALVGQLDPTTRHRSAWWYAFYVFSGIAMLSKGLMGFALPATILGLYVLLAVMPYDAQSFREHGRWLTERGFRQSVREGRAPMPALWAQFSRMRLLSGLGVFLAVAGPWFLVLDLFQGVDDEGKDFLYRFWIHDHFNRLASGVHTTTPGGTFTYFIEQGGYAIFPWVAAVPGALAVASRLRMRGGNRTAHAGLIALLWVLVSLLVVGVSATKFHHYVFPVIPGAAILIALFVDRVWEEGIERHAVALLVGFLLFILVGKDLVSNPKAFADLFVYNYDRAYPTELLTRSVAMVFGRPLVTGHLLGVGLVLGGLYVLLEAWRARGVGARVMGFLLTGSGLAVLVTTLNRGSIHLSLGIGVTLLLTAVMVGLEAFRLNKEQRTSLVSMALVMAVVGVVLTVRGAGGDTGSRMRGPLLELVSVRSGLGFAFTAAGVLAGLAALQRSRVALFGTGWVFAAGFALWLGWGHWVELSHHWTQRDLFWRYYRQARPGEPIAAFYMNWRGETFYSRNTVKQVKDQAVMRRFVEQPGREWALVEHNRVNLLRTSVGADKTVTLVDKDVNNKFVLVTID